MYQLEELDQGRHACRVLVIGRFIRRYLQYGSTCELGASTPGSGGAKQEYALREPLDDVALTKYLQEQDEYLLYSISDAMPIMPGVARECLDPLQRLAVCVDKF